MEKLIGIRYKTAKPMDFFMVVPLRTQYRLPKGVKPSDIEIKIIVSSPQDNFDELEKLPVQKEEVVTEYEANYSGQFIHNETVVIEKEKMFRLCKKCDGPMEYIQVCCDDKVKGIKEHWYCRECHHRILVR